MKSKRVILGTGGHCRSVLDTLLAAQPDVELVLVGQPEEIGEIVIGSWVVTEDDSALFSLFQKGYSEAFVTIGQAAIRKRLMESVGEMGFSFPPVVDPTAIVSPFARLEEGVFIGKRAVINANVTVGKGTIINTGAIVEHDCQVGAYAHLAPGSVLCGSVRVGDETHVGAGSVIREGMEIGRNALIGAGSVIVRNVEDGKTVVGNPGKEYKK